MKSAAACIGLQEAIVLQCVQCVQCVTICARSHCVTMCAMCYNVCKRPLCYNVLKCVTMCYNVCNVLQFAQEAIELQSKLRFSIISVSRVNYTWGSWSNLQLTKLLPGSKVSVSVRPVCSTPNCDLGFNMISVWWTWPLFVTEQC